MSGNVIPGARDTPIILYSLAETLDSRSWFEDCRTLEFSSTQG